MQIEPKIQENEVIADDFTGLDDGLANSSEDAYQGDYTIEQVKVGNKTMNKRIGTFTPKEAELPALEDIIKEAQAKQEAQGKSQDRDKSKDAVSK